jgi:hypothetical protein
MRRIHGLWSRQASEIRRASWIEDSRDLGLDLVDRDLEMHGLETRTSDHPVLRIRWLLKEKHSAHGAYHRAFIVPDEGAPEPLGPSLSDVSSLASQRGLVPCVILP